MRSDKVNVPDAFGRITEPWRPRVAAELNGQAVKLVRRMEFRDRTVASTDEPL